MSGCLRRWSPHWILESWKTTRLLHSIDKIVLTNIVNRTAKMHKETVLQDSLSGIQSHINSKKAACQQSLLQQCGYEAALRALTENGVASTSCMSIALFEETSELWKKIANEKDLCWRITITQSSLMDNLNEISASASGKPGATGKRLQKVNPGDTEASLSGRVSVAFCGMMEEAGLYPFFTFNWCPYMMLLTGHTTSSSPTHKSIPRMAQCDPNAKVGSYSDGMSPDMIDLYPTPADGVFCRGNVWGRGWLLGNVTGYLGFCRVTCAHTHQNLHLHLWAQVFVGMGSGFMKTCGYPNLHRGMPSEMTNKPHKGSASVHQHCCATLQGSESHGNGNQGAEHAPQSFNGIMWVASSHAWLNHTDHIKVGLVCKERSMGEGQ